MCARRATGTVSHPGRGCNRRHRWARFGPLSPLLSKNRRNDVPEDVGDRCRHRRNRRSFATQIGHAQTASARAVVERAAAALGGVERIRAVKNITLHGYGQYAYQMGGGRISASPDAPEKYMAANDLTRLYDLEHDPYYPKIQPCINREGRGAL